jgi:hypothetical protein
VAKECIPEDGKLATRTEHLNRHPDAVFLVQDALFEPEFLRAFRRIRAEEIRNPAEPNIASTIVGFSGESVQPVCAWANAGIASNAKPTNKVQNAFFIV